MLDWIELLKDETYLVDLVEPTLPILKSLIARGFDPRFQPVTLLSKTVNGLLSACLQHVDDVRCDDTSFRTSPRC